MKKYLKFIFAAIAAGSILSGCSDFLDRNPQDKVTDINFWKTESDVVKALTGCYNTLYSSPLFNHTNFDFDGFTDNAFNGHSQVYVNGLTSQTGAVISNTYYAAYNSIARFNEFISHVEGMSLNESKKNTYLAEVYFLRALNYFTLTSLYGAVPLIVEPYQIGDEIMMKSSRADIIKQILSDLDFSISNLPDTKYNGHAVKGAAQLLKVRVLMSEKKWSEAASLSKSMMNKTFSLSDNYPGIFEDQGQKDNPEIIFSTEYLMPLQPHDNPLRYGWWISLNPYVSFTEVFECKDGKSIKDSPLYDPNHPYDNRDPRLFYNIVTPGSEWKFDKFETFDVEKYKELQALPLQTGLILRKGYEWYRTLKSDPTNCSSQANIVLMRYAEVLLNFAEAENEANGPTAAVYDAVNQLRARKGVEMPPYPAGLSKDQMRQRIRNERRVELAFEAGSRLFDLKRWGIEEEVLNGFDTHVSGRILNFKPHYKLWPIPQAEIDFYKNHELDYGQNEGYD